MHTQICITVDTEFSIAGAFANPALRPVAEPFVWCEVGGRSEGLGFLLDCFKKYCIPATFFIEALHRYYFQNDPMGPIVRRIQDQGHELQLHLHPAWSVFQHSDWWQRVQQHPRQDDFCGRSEVESVALIHNGIQAFHDWELPAPQVFRSGSLQHDDTLYRALSRTNIPYSSNIGLAIFDSRNPQYQLYSGSHERHGILESPVLTYSDWQLGGRRHLKTLTIAGTSFAETKYLLEQAHRLRIPLVVILTHPFEFIQSQDVELRQARRHSVNQHRMTQLCRFLYENRDRFVASGLAASSATVRREQPQNHLLRSGLLRGLARMATQVSYDRFGKCALSLRKGLAQ